MVRTRLVLLFGLLSFWACACQDLGPEGSSGAIATFFENAGTQPAWYVAAEQELSHRLDIIPSFPIASGGPTLIPPGQSVLADIMGYAPGKDFVIFLYRVSSSDPSRAVYTRAISVSATELAANHFRVTFTDPATL